MNTFNSYNSGEYLRNDYEMDQAERRYEDWARHTDRGLSDMPPKKTQMIDHSTCKTIIETYSFLHDGKVYIYRIIQSTTPRTGDANQLLDITLKTTSGERIELDAVSFTAKDPKYKELVDGIKAALKKHEEEEIAKI